MSLGEGQCFDVIELEEKPPPTVRNEVVTTKPTIDGIQHDILSLKPINQLNVNKSKYIIHV